jgi:hypothetical protein
MLISLRTLEGDVAAKLVLLSSGKAEAHAAMALRSTILLDENLVGAAAFGARGTPMAVLLNDDGTLGSDILSGASSILEFARRELRRQQDGIINECDRVDGTQE